MLAQGGASHFAPDPRAAPRRRLDATARTAWQTTVPDDFYSTDYYTDKLLEYLDDDRGDGKPFLALAAYTSPHWPLQAPDEFIDRYEGRYDAGYEADPQARASQRQKRARRDPVGLRAARAAAFDARPTRAGRS